MQPQADVIADTQQVRQAAQGKAAPPGVTADRHQQAPIRARSCRLAESLRSRTRRSSATWLAIYVLRRAVYALQRERVDDAGAHGLRTAAGHWYLRGKSQLWVILIDARTADRMV